jgi:hypothetical protein
VQVLLRTFLSVIVKVLPNQRICIEAVPLLTPWSILANILRLGA